MATHENGRQTVGPMSFRDVVERAAAIRDEFKLAGSVSIAVDCWSHESGRVSLSWAAFYHETSEIHSPHMRSEEVEPLLAELREYCATRRDQLGRAGCLSSLDSIGAPGLVSTGEKG